VEAWSRGRGSATPPPPGHGVAPKSASTTVTSSHAVAGGSVHPPGMHLSLPSCKDARSFSVCCLVLPELVIYK
jgi:hypothetical protein